MAEQKKKKETPKKINNYLKYSGMAFTMIIMICLGVFGGIYLDKKVNWEFPVFTVVCSLLGVFLGMYYALKDFIKPNK